MFHLGKFPNHTLGKIGRWKSHCIEYHPTKIWKLEYCCICSMIYLRISVLIVVFSLSRSVVFSLSRSVVFFINSLDKFSSRSPVRRILHQAGPYNFVKVG